MHAQSTQAADTSENDSNDTEEHSPALVMKKKTNKCIQCISFCHVVMPQVAPLGHSNSLLSATATLTLHAITSAATATAAAIAVVAVVIAAIPIRL
jgi:hypothetical protein